MVGQRNADIRLRPSQKSQTKPGPKVAAAAHQIQFADQELTSTSTGPAKSRGPGPGRLLRSPTSLHLHVGERRAIASPSETKLATTLGVGGWGGVSGVCFTRPSVCPQLCTSHRPKHARESQPRSAKPPASSPSSSSPAPPPESGMVNNRPRAFQINGGSQAVGLRKLRQRGAK